MILITWLAIKKVASFSYFSHQYDKRWLYTLPCVSWETHTLFHTPTLVIPLGQIVISFWFVQWLVASFLTWHSLHGKPAPAYSFAGQQPRASLLSCHSSLSISERVQNCKYFFCFFSSTIFFFFILVFSHVYIFDYWSIHFLLYFPFHSLLYIEETRFISLFPPFYSIHDVFKPDPN